MEGKTLSQKHEWLTPHKLPLLVLIKYLCIPESQENEHAELRECVTRHRHGLSLLLLELIQVCVFVTVIHYQEMYVLNYLIPWCLQHVCLTLS